jgi:hypothetical protein
MAASDENDKNENRISECRWQVEQLPNQIKDLVLDDQKKRNEICWNVFNV